MFFRLLFALTLLLGLATGPVAAGDCVKSVPCGPCCAQPVADCCTQSQMPQMPSLATAHVDVKSVVAPVLVCMRTVPEFALPTFAAQDFAAARRPVPPLAARTCVRLI